MLNRVHLQIIFGRWEVSTNHGFQQPGAKKSDLATAQWRQKITGLREGVSRIVLAAPLEARICSYSAGSEVPKHTVESLIEKILWIQVTNHCAYLSPGEDT